MPEHTNSLHVLVIEDDYDIAENIADYLEVKGHVSDFASNGVQGLQLALENEYDVIVLDIMMPGMDGLTVCREFRKKAKKHVPILMLTARDTLADKLAGFDSGTDDYLVKPFALEELEARLRVLGARGTRKSSQVLKVGDLQLDAGAMQATRAGIPIDLNRVCLTLLVRLMTASPNVVSRQELEHLLWGDTPPETDSLRSHLYALRKKIDKPFKTSLLHTVHGLGYKISESA